MRNRNRLVPLAIAGLLLIAAGFVVAVVYLTNNGPFERSRRPLTSVSTVAGLRGELGEPYGVAVKGSEIYVSDGLHDKIWRISEGAEPVEFAAGLSTPSAIAFDKKGDLIVADTGSHTIKKIDPTGAITVLAGTQGESGDSDGPALSAHFNAPVGLAVLDNGSIAVSDTYNDKIKLIRDGSVTTLAGSTRGFADGASANSRFDTPCGVAAWDNGSILVADTLNSRIRLVAADGRVTTVAGRDNAEVRDGTLGEAAFYRPLSIAVGPDGSIFVGDNNAVRLISNRAIPFVETISDERRGFADGMLRGTRFDRISGMAIMEDFQVFLADSDNGVVRRIFAETGPKREVLDRTTKTDPAEFRSRQPPRWPYDPPAAKRDIAGTLGEIRGEYVDENSRPRFHNGLDIAGGYGEPARFIRDEKVLDPLSAENFGTLRELIRLPTIGYIHIRLGRDSSDRPLGDPRFQFATNNNAEIVDVRVRRGTQFRAGEIIGTLNAMNHIHMIAGPSGDEMNALDALDLPGVSDAIPPTIEDVSFFDQNWLPVETKGPQKRITLASNTRVVVRAFDRMDGNPERRRLGVYKVGYQVLDRDHSAMTGVNWNISFDRNPSADAVKFAYAPGSQSGPTGETIFRYTVTNKVSGEAFSEGFIEPAAFTPGQYVLRVFAADYFGNTTSRDISFEVAK